jgi:putative ABC transport system permease protein
MRQTSFRMYLLPLLAGGVVAFFLMIMVGLGLSGVLWQNVIRRTHELGLRRAVGASRTQVFVQILLEVLCLTGVGLLLGVVLVLQLPLLGIGAFVPPAVYAAGLLGAMAAIVLLAAGCSLYPATLASRVTPAEALRYE